MAVKWTLSLPEELVKEVLAHIEERFGNGNVRARSLIVREALREYLDSRKKLSKK